MPVFDFPDLPSQFRELLGQCRELYVSSGETTARQHPHLLPGSGEQFIELMEDLHRALVVKVFVTICEADRRWSKNEKFLAEVLLFHLWSEWLEGEQLREALREMTKKTAKLRWYALVRPFDQIAPLRNRIGELETIAVRLANLIARADGPIQPIEAARVKKIQDELYLHLRQIPIDEPGEHQQADEASSQAIKKVFRTGDLLPLGDANRAAETAGRVDQSTEQQEPPPPTLDEALEELDQLIGLETVKEEVRTLANFLKIQTKREEAGLPVARLSLHMVFQGNPGTGKTTVARIVGKIFGAMGILKKGHLVETDRSGLVAEYAGQTGPKTNKKIDEALDGVLFIDEAYTLISQEGDDAFGHEAVQTLLKRMEDDRERLVVILAGYPDEMQKLLRSNPGLSSRFSRKLEFVDYTPLELARIFGLMTDKNHYRLDADARGKVILGLTHLYERRDRHFGNGRTSRNLFEHAIREQANRIAAMAELSVEQLSTLEAADIEFLRCPTEVFLPLTEGTLYVYLSCPACAHGKDAPHKYLSESVRCPKCEHSFVPGWGMITQD